MSRRELAFMWWLGGVVVLYALHLPLGMYHEGWDHYAFCFAFSLPPAGITMGCFICIVWLWATPPSRLTLLRKFCFTVLAICVAIPIVWVSGFVFLLTHLAP